MDNRILYLDESGKTGTQRYTGKWNFAEQPYFALCGLLINEDKLNEIDQFIKSLRKSYKIQGEIKATKNSVRKNYSSLIEQIWNKQRELGCELFIEIVNKKFCISMMITNYCVCPYYDIPLEKYESYEVTMVRKNFANFICETINDELLGEFVEFFDNNTQDLVKMKSLCQKLIECVDYDAVIENIKETLDSVNNYEKLGLLKRHLFPLVDHYKGDCSSVAVCPHVDSFNNILNRIGCIDNIVIIHDKLADLGDALEQIVKKRIGEDDVSNIIHFEDSRQLDMLQLSDFWCGIVNDSVQKILIGEKGINPIIDQLIQTKINFVSTFREQELLFPNDPEINQWVFWYRDYFNK